VEAFSLRVEAVGAGDTSVVDCGHGFVALVAWQFHLVVLNNILLDDCVTALRVFEFRLGKSFSIEVALRDETIVAGDVRCHLGSSHGQVMAGVGLLISLVGQLLAGVASVRSVRQIVFRREVGTAGSIGFTGQTPHRGSRLGSLLVKGLLNFSLVGGGPVG
jgi:hypothetical protein